MGETRDHAVCRVERCGEYWVPVITWPRAVVMPACVCVSQAVAMVTRDGTRPVTFVGVYEMRGGELVRVAWSSFDEVCGVLDPLHVHTHRHDARRAFGYSGGEAVAS